MSKLCSGQTLELQIQGWFIANPFNDCDFSLMTPKRLRMLKSKISIGSIIKYTVCILMNTYIFGYVIQHYLSYILFIRMGHFTIYWHKFSCLHSLTFFSGQLIFALYAFRNLPKKIMSAHNWIFTIANNF